MLRFILLAILLMLVARAFWRVVDGVIEASGGRPRRQAGGPAVRLVRDPVCGTHVAPSGALTVVSGGSTHYFCSERCRNEFRARR